MAGGYIVCGEFSGDDKSGSAISGVFQALPECIPQSEQDSFVESILNPLADYLEENEDHILIDADTATALLPPVDALYERYGNELGLPEPFDAPSLDEAAGLAASDAKWGQGIGWRYYCLHDLRIALRRSVKTGESVVVSFD